MAMLTTNKLLMKSIDSYRRCHKLASTTTIFIIILILNVQWHVADALSKYLPFFYFYNSLTTLSFVFNNVISLTLQFMCKLCVHTYCCFVIY